MGMYYNGANCDIYIGKGAGKKLLMDIRNSRKSVRIVSPYLSPSLIQELLHLQKRNINVELITTDDIEDFYGNKEKNINKLIIQNRELDQLAYDKRERWKGIAKNLLYIIIGLSLMSITLVYYYRELKLSLVCIPILFLFLIYQLFTNKIKNKRIYSYWYNQLFPFKVYMSPEAIESSDTFIHGKIYLIDDNIAYFGSLNFTYRGTRQNYETRVRTTDLNAISKIKEEFHQLLYHSSYPEKNIQDWGKQLYDEPIN